MFHGIFLRNSHNIEFTMGLEGLQSTEIPLRKFDVIKYNPSYVDHVPLQLYATWVLHVPSQNIIMSPPPLFVPYRGQHMLTL